MWCTNPQVRLTKTITINRWNVSRLFLLFFFSLLHSYFETGRKKRRKNNWLDPKMNNVLSTRLRQSTDNTFPPVENGFFFPYLSLNEKQKIKALSHGSRILNKIIEGHRHWTTGGQLTFTIIQNMWTANIEREVSGSRWNTRKGEPRALHVSVRVDAETHWGGGCEKLRN